MAYGRRERAIELVILSRRAGAE